MGYLSTINLRIYDTGETEFYFTHDGGFPLTEYVHTLDLNIKSATN